MVHAHERYQEKPFLGSSHSWALHKLQTLGSEACVLDIGPGSGVIGRQLKEREFRELYAVEIDPETRKHLSGVYREIAGDLGSFHGRAFDCLLLLDVLEHMTAPEPFLEEAIKLVKSGGIILISVPNVAHWSVRFPLLFGAFCYTERGILDRTHYQFFTRRRLRSLLSACANLRIVEMAGSIEPIEFLLPKAFWENGFWRLLSHLRLALASFLPGLMAFQHLVFIEKRE